MFLPSRWKFSPSLKLICYDHPLPNYSVIAADTLREPDLWPFDLGLWSYMAGHVINPSTKFEDPTAIRSWVMSSDISHWQCVCSHCAWAVSRDLCVGGKFFPHIWNSWPRFVYSLYTLYGATIKTNGVIPVKDHRALCARGKSRQPWTLPKIFYHHSSRRPRFSVNRFKFWQLDSI